MIYFSPLKHNAIEALIRLEEASTPYPWTAQSLADSLDAPADGYLIQCQSESIGYCVVQPVLDEAELLNIVIFKPFQSRGYGAEVIRKLKLQLAESGTKNLFLEVRASNAIAKALYEKTGFEEVNIRRNYYRAGKQAKEDALVMRCSLN